jgi:hypothetical protein
VQPFGTKGWRFYNPYGDVVWEGSLDQLSSIYDIADADVGDEAAFFLVEAAKNADRGIKNNPGRRSGSQATKTIGDATRVLQKQFRDLAKLTRVGRRNLIDGMRHGEDGYLLTVEDAYVIPTAAYPFFDDESARSWINKGDFTAITVVFWNGRSWTPVENTGSPRRAAEKLLELSSASEVRAAIKKAPSFAKSRNNPCGTRPPGVSQATKTFENFNEYPSKGASKFAREIIVPERMPSPGPCRWLTYRSNKWNDGTHDYIHTIASYPRVKCAMAGENYPTIKIPAKVREATTLTQIGLRALGFAFEYDDDEYEAKVPAGTEWFWSQTARALYLIQNKRKLVAVIWGGNLNVEPRGIVG